MIRSQLNFLSSQILFRLRIQFFSNSKLIKPEDDIVNFKEALIFALLGVLKQREEINTLKSVTGSKRDSSGGTLICY